jgi:hypothetical protein
LDCKCCGEPAYWNADPRYRLGGFYRCPVKARGHAMRRYDEKPVYRIEKKLKANARKRRENIERLRAALLTDREGESAGKVSHQG